MIEHPSRVVVLLATYQGMPWLPDQLASILDQRDVEVRIVVSDDGSDDGTLDALAAATPGRVTLLPRRETGGGSAQNFLHLIDVAEVDADEYVAFADQDDLWLPDKLSRHVTLLKHHEADAVSSSIEALYPDGSRKLIRKDHPQRRLDFICESPGPGSTYLLTPAAFATIRADLATGVVDEAQVGFHDWLIYALLRARGRKWLIDHWPSVTYRQHESNEMGANRGLAAARARLGMLSRGWYREQFILTADAAAKVATADLAPQIRSVRKLLGNRGPIARVRLAAACWQLRRRVRDRLVLAATCLVGLW